MLITWKELVRRLNPGLSQQAIGQKYGLSQKSISNLLSKDHHPIPENQLKIAKGEGKQLWELYRWMEEGTLPTN